jgi:hypothetical protein
MAETFDLNKRERLDHQLEAILQLIGVAIFNINCVKQDNADQEQTELFDLLFSGLLDDAMNELNAAGNLISYALQNPKPQTGYSEEENN